MSSLRHEGLVELARQHPPLPTTTQRETITTSTDLRLLDMWPDRALTATTADDVLNP